MCIISWNSWQALLTLFFGSTHCPPECSKIFPTLGQENRRPQELRAQFPVPMVWWLFLWCASVDHCRRTLPNARFHISNSTCCHWSSSLLSSSSKSFSVGAIPYRNIEPKPALFQLLWVFSSERNEKESFIQFLDNYELLSPHFIGRLGAWIGRWKPALVMTQPHRPSKERGPLILRVTYYLSQMVGIKEALFYFLFLHWAGFPYFVSVSSG